MRLLREKAAGATYASLSACYVYDSHGNLAAVVTVLPFTGKGGGEDGGLTMEHLKAYGGTVRDLAGPFGTVGGSFGVPTPFPVAGGLDGFAGPGRYPGQGIVGVVGAVGVGVGLEGHAGVNFTPGVHVVKPGTLEWYWVF